MKFEVDTKFVFSGKFTIEAENVAQVKKIVHEQCGLTIGRGIHSTLPEEKVEWDFAVHPEKITGRVRRIK